MKQILITLVAVVLGSTAISSYAGEVRLGDKRVHVLEYNKGSPTVTEESNSEVSDEGKKHTDPWFRAEEPSEVVHPRKCREKHNCPSPGGIY